MKRLLIVLTSALIFCSCKVETNFNYKGADDIAGVYKVYMGKIDSLEIFIVDGNLVRREIYPDFIFGGNEQRYTFVPRNEIWIDNTISCKEYSTTLQHEINELYLMRNFGRTYLQAHDSSLMLEVKMRNDYRNECIEHEKYLPEMPVTDTDSIKQIKSIPDKIKLKDVYLQKREMMSGKYTVWLVNGDMIRREIYPDFGFTGDRNDYNFIPENEIWIDGNISCGEYIFSLEDEKYFIEQYSATEDYEGSVQQAKEKVLSLRVEMFNKLANKFVKIDRNKKLYRDVGEK